jgi:low density lipoprotein receptor-related protein 5/6
MSTAFNILGVSRVPIMSLVFCIVVPLAAGHCLAVSEPRLYWTTFTSGETSKVQRASLDGTGIEDLITGLDAPWPIEIDPLRRKLFYGDVNREVIERANLDGTGVETIHVGVPIDNPSGLAIDPVNNELYWSDHVYDRIHKTDLDTNVTTVMVSAGLTNPFGLALDLEAGKLYWADTGIGSPGKIQRSNLDGTNVEDLVTGLSNPRDVAIDFVGGHFFWPDLDDGAIYRAELDGSDAGAWLTDIGGSDAVAIDPISRRLYWTSDRDGISNIRLDGSDLRVGVVPPLNQFGIAILVPEPCGEVLCFLALAIVCMWCRLCIR